MKLKITNLHMLLDDYQDIFIRKTSEASVIYDEVELITKTYHNDFYIDVFLIEPKIFYKINFPLKDGKIVVINNKLIKAGIISHVDNQDGVIYLYNAGDNVVYLQYDTIIGDYVEG